MTTIAIPISSATVADESSNTRPTNYYHDDLKTNCSTLMGTEDFTYFNRDRAVSWDTNYCAEHAVNDEFLVHLKESDMVKGGHEDHSGVPFVNPAEDFDAINANQQQDLPSGEGTPILYRSLSRSIAETTAYPPAAHVIVDESNYEVSKSRTEFISATVILDKSKHSPGIRFKRRGGVLRVTYVDKNGVFGKTDIRVGDQVMSINNVSCKKGDSKSAKHLMKKSSHVCNIVVRNDGGDAGLVTSTVMKPSPTALVGLGLKRINGTIRVSTVDTEGLFAQSLLEKGHRCLFINDISCANTSLSHAAELVLSARDQVTIVTMPTSGSAMVVSALSLRWWHHLGARLLHPKFVCSRSA